MRPFKRHIIKEQLGQVLVQRGVISAAQLNQALTEQKKSGALLGEALISLGFTSEEEIAQALAIQHDYPYLPLTNYDVDPGVIGLIPEDLAKKYCLLPVDKMGDILTVVMANPLDKTAIEELEKISRSSIEIFVTTYTEIKEAIKRCYKQQSQPDGGDQDGKVA